MSKRETILDRLRDTILPAITVAGGYNLTVRAVKRGLQEIDALADHELPALYIARTTEERENLTQNQFTAKLQVIIVGYVKNSTGIEGVQEDLDKLIADVTKVIETDRLLGLTGTVYSTEILRVVTDEGDKGSLAACAITIEIKYASEGVTP